MSELSDKIAAVNTALDDAVTRVNTEITALKDEIARLGATPADIAALDAAETKAKDLVTATPTPTPPPPTPPTEPVPPPPTPPPTEPVPPTPPTP